MPICSCKFSLNFSYLYFMMFFFFHNYRICSVAFATRSFRHVPAIVIIWSVTPKIRNTSALIVAKCSSPNIMLSCIRWRYTKKGRFPLCSQRTRPNGYRSLMWSNQFKVYRGNITIKLKVSIYTWGLFFCMHGFSIWATKSYF